MDWVKRIRVGWIVSKEESGMHSVKKKKRLKKKSKRLKKKIVNASKISGNAKKRKCLN